MIMWSYEERKKERKKEESRNQNSPNSFGELKIVKSLSQSVNTPMAITGNFQVSL